MPFVGRNLTTLSLQRQGQLKELEQKSKNRIYFMKNKQHTQDTGSSLIAGRPQRSTLEQYLDKSKIDENIENYLVKELGGSAGEAKRFIQGLDDTLKEYLLDRLPAFKRVFLANFTIPTVINLQSAFELFNREQLNKIRNVEIPSSKDLENYLNSLNDKPLHDLGVEVYIQLQRKTRGRNPADSIVEFSNEFDASFDKSKYVKDICVDYVRTFDTDIEGYTALSNIGNNVGLRDFPKPELKRNKEGIPTSKIDLDVESDISREIRELLEGDEDFDLPYKERGEIMEPIIEEEEKKSESSIGEFGEKVKGVQRYLELFRMNKPALIELFGIYESIYNRATPEQQTYELGRPFTPKELNKMNKKDIVLKLIEYGFNPRSGEFDIGQDYEGIDYETANPNIMFGDEMEKLDDYIISNYNAKGNQLRPDLDLTPMEGFGYLSRANKPGLVKIFKLKN